MKHKTYFLLLFWICSDMAIGQQISIRSVNSAGQSRNSGGIHIEDALGGLVVESFNTSTFLYTQDFLQPDAGTTSGPLYINNVILNGGSGLDNAGKSMITGGIMMEFTLGEVASITLNNSNLMLTQGILQPNLYCSDVLTLTIANMPLTGGYFAAQEIRIVGSLQINSNTNITFGAPILKIEAPNSLTAHIGSTVTIRPEGCLN